MNDNNENTFSHPRAAVNEQGEVIIQQVPPIGDQAFETAQRMIAENAPKQEAPQARTLNIDPKTGITTVRQADGTEAPASPHQLKIVLLQTATLELQRKGLRPGTRNFRRMFLKRTGYGFEQLQHEIRAESEQLIARLAQAAATQSGMLSPETTSVEAPVHARGETPFIQHIDEAGFIAADPSLDEPRGPGLILNADPNDASGDATVIEHLADRPDTIAGLDAVFAADAEQAAA